MLFLAIMLSFNLCGVAFAASQPILSSKTGKQAHLRFLSGPNGGQWFMMGEKIAGVLTSGVLPTSNRIGGGLSNINEVNKKAADIAFTVNSFLGASNSGDAEYASLKIDNVSILANAYPQVFYFLVRKDFALKYNIKTIDDMLKLDTPVRFASLRQGTASEFILKLLLKYGYGTDFDKLQAKGWTIDFSNYSEIADNFAAGSIDSFAYTAGTNVPLIHTIEKYVDILILPVNQSAIDKLASKFRTYKYTIKSGAYQCVKTPITTVGDYTSLIVRKDLPSDLVYSIAKILMENKITIAANVSDFMLLSPKTAVAEGFLMHSGARRFWEELNSSVKQK